MKPQHALFAMLLAGCVPEGNSTPSDAGGASNPASPAFHPSMNIMTAVFEDSFDRISRPPPPLASVMPSVTSSASAAPSGSAAIPPLAMLSSSAAAQAAPPDDLGPNWRQASTNVWHIENGRLCAQNGQNHGVWLTKVLPINARIEFNGIAQTPQGDVKAEVWGDGQSHATAMSYTNATSYLAILGGWKNKFHVLARINEHGNDRKQIVIDPQSDDMKEKPVVAGQSYHFKIERTDGKTVRWSVNDEEYLSFEDSQPLTGQGHDHFGFNNWDVKVCYDNVKVTPLP